MMFRFEIYDNTRITNFFFLELLHLVHLNRILTSSQMWRKFEQIRYNPIKLGKQASTLLRMRSAGFALRRMNELAAHMSTDATSEPEVLFRDQFAARIYTLNRPPLNVLNHDMVKTLRAQIEVGKPKCITGGS
jgi:hypothetical protein